MKPPSRVPFFAIFLSRHIQHRTRRRPAASTYRERKAGGEALRREAVGRCALPKLAPAPHAPVTDPGTAGSVGWSSSDGARFRSPELPRAPAGVGGLPLAPRAEIRVTSLARRENHALWQRTGDGRCTQERRGTSDSHLGAPAARPDGIEPHREVRRLRCRRINPCQGCQLTSMAFVRLNAAEVQYDPESRYHNWYVRTSPAAISPFDEIGVALIDGGFGDG